MGRDRQFCAARSGAIRTAMFDQVPLPLVRAGRIIGVQNLRLCDHGRIRAMTVGLVQVICPGG